MFGWRLPNLAMPQVQPPNLWRAKRLQHFYEFGSCELLLPPVTKTYRLGQDGQTLKTTNINNF
jgi:hypothetical protein